MSKQHESSEKLHNVLYFMSGAMVVILVLIIVVGVKTNKYGFMIFVHLHSNKM